MNLTITTEAASHYKEEMELAEGDILRLFCRVGGVGSGGFSIGVTVEQEVPADAYSVQVEGITFVVHESDAWYLDGMVIDYNQDLDYLHFENKKIGDVINPR
ncbi:iron-sulfur cluster biosynthesis family protein [Salsuginibacillus kocurii]|uniref:iron-sulfur cluster biosynthesis family protein n=1 Tax=Salsuginibacillus kocurii TaxID=427078 RepID=UPI000368447B|nr:iron-sulfur cluster biosynthesis family protein [Salsuginibacillus kocurii]